MSTVCSATLLGGLVDLDVLDDQVGGIETLGIGVGFGVLEKSKEEFCRLDWVTSFGDTECLAWKEKLLAGCRLCRQRIL